MHCGENQSCVFALHILFLILVATLKKLQKLSGKIVLEKGKANPLMDAENNNAASLREHELLCIRFNWCEQRPKISNSRIVQAEK